MDMFSDLFPNFDATKEETLGVYEPIPDGEYPAMMTKAELVHTRDFSGRYYKTEWIIVDGKYKDRNVWLNINVENKNAMAAKIARKTIASICLASGVARPTSIAELCNVPMTIVVGHEKDMNDTLRNKIKNFKPIADYKPQQNAAPPWGGGKEDDDVPF